MNWTFYFKLYKTQISWLIPILLISKNPTFSSLSLLAISLAICSHWNFIYVMYLVILIFVSGILVMLLYITNLINNQLSKSSLKWLALSSLTLVIVDEPSPAENEFSFQLIWSSSYIGFLIFSLLFLCAILVLLSWILKDSKTLRS